MKVLCERCKKDISVEIDKHFEKIILGRAKCPHCGITQGRFICDTDLYLYLGICEAIYLPITYLTAIAYDKMDQNWWIIFIFLAIFAAIVYIQKNTSRLVYKRAYDKIPLSEQKDTETLMKTRKTINTSFLIYFVLAIAAIMVKDYRIESLFGLAIIMIVSFINFYKNIKDKKNK